MNVLGIDAGGTKTVCYLADGDGSVLGEARAGGASLQAEGELGVEKVLHAVMDQALGDQRRASRRSAWAWPAPTARQTARSRAGSCAGSGRRPRSCS